MSQELIQAGQNLPAFAQRAGLPAGVNAGAVAIEVERAVAEAKGQMQLAKMFPRDLNGAYAELMEACKLPALAGVAFYSVPQGGQKVTGPSIRLAEEIARVYGNFEFGHRELSRIEAGPGPREFGRSEIEVYAWDKQTNNRSIRQITVLHVLDTKEGPRKLRDQKDIDNKIANVASKQSRGRILAMMPKWMVEAAIEECKKTLAGNNQEPLSVRARKMTQAFATYGVTTEHLERYLGHKLDEILLDELADLTGVFNALKDGTPASEFFGAEEPQSTGKSAAEDLASEAKAGAAAAAQRQPRQSRQRAEPEKPAEQEKAPESKEPEKNSSPVEEQNAAAPEGGAQPEEQAEAGDVF
ncbi:hypothetical protein K32_48320 [Kaistia sp. 32K]|uniref:hypothetical protein n=1 Tax=Kaistia sp. 32K TaxID=2795690 RepID=UPI0019152B48|nr:hypothetical protein [Kaistia sp. 32K]BCP56215.1 hypothetical protein K32_48320 [Kaistia sp. 32K]